MLRSDSPAVVAQTVGRLSAPETPALGASAASSTPSGGPRKVRLSDRELLRRVQRVVVSPESVTPRLLTPRRGWKHVSTGVRHDMSVFSRSLRTDTILNPSPAFVQSQQLQVAAVGDIRAQASELVALLRAPTESESNALFKACFGSCFIYSSLVHAVPALDHGGLASPPPVRNAATSVDQDAGQQLMVRTASFVHTGLLPLLRRDRALPAESESFSTSTTTNSRVGARRRTCSSTPTSNSTQKNNQCCYIELLTPTREGFRLQFCSLNAGELTAGKAPPDRVTDLHPFTGWLTAEPVAGRTGFLHVTFQGTFLGQQSGGCGTRVAQARLLRLAKGVCRLEKMLRRRRRRHRWQTKSPGRLWHAAVDAIRAVGGGGALGAITGVTEEDAGGSHHNWHCIHCTRGFLPALRKRWRRCDLCAYRVCDAPSCCSHERVAIYNRYVAPLLVCARCRECIDERDGRSSVAHAGMSTGDVRYTGAGLRFADLEGEMEPELELDPSVRSGGRWGIAEDPSRVSSTTARRKRRSQSDPPVMLSLALTSSGEEHSSSTDVEQGPAAGRGFY